MYRSFVLIYLVCGLVVSSWAQTPFNQRLSLSYPASTFAAIHVTDSCYYTVGLVVDTIPPNKSGTSFCKFNLSGDLLFYQVLTSSEETYEVWDASLKPVEGLGLMTLGYSLDEDNSGMLLLYTPNGDTLWLHKFKSYYYPENTFNRPVDFHPNADGGAIILSRNSHPNLERHGAIHLQQMDHTGLTLWEEIYDTEFSDRARSLLIRANGDILIGAYQSGSNLDPKDYPARTWVMCLDSSRQLKWEYYSPEEEFHHGAEAMAFSHDGGIVGASGWGTPLRLPSTTRIEWDGLFFKLDSMGQLEWQTKLDVFEAENNAFNAIVAASDGSGYIAAGDLRHVDFEAQKADNSGWLAKVSPAGDSLWSRRITILDNVAADRHAFYDLKETVDGGFVIVGQAIDQDGTTPPPSQQAWIVKVDRHGCLVPGCQTVSTQDLPQPQLQIQLYPNPTSDQLNIFIQQEEERTRGHFRIVDNMGKRWRTFKHQGEEGSYLLSVRDYPAGQYYLQYIEEGKVKRSEAFIVMR